MHAIWADADFCVDGLKLGCGLSVVTCSGTSAINLVPDRRHADHVLESAPACTACHVAVNSHSSPVHVSF